MGWTEKLASKLKNDGSVMNARICAPCPVGADFRLCRERFWHRWAMVFSTALERQTGDAEFDRAVFIASDDPRVARALRKSPEARAIAASLLMSKCPGIECKDSSLHIQLKPGKREGKALDEFLDKSRQQWAEPLARLAQTLTEAEPSLKKYQPEPNDGIDKRFSRMGWILGSAYALFFGWFMFNVGIDGKDWSVAPLPWFGYGFFFAAQLAAICAGAIAIYRHSSRLPLGLGKALAFAVSYATLATPMVLDTLNKKVDSSAPLAKYQATVGSIEVKVKRGYSKRFVVSPPSEDLLLRADILPEYFAWKDNFDGSSEWKQAMGSNKQALVWIQKGFLGLPVVRRIEPCLPSNPCQ